MTDNECDPMGINPERQKRIVRLRRSFDGCSEEEKFRVDAAARDRAHGVLENLAYSLKLCTVDGLYLEFGVWKGMTINLIAEIVDPKRVWGFDSFEGLPEDWLGPESPSNFTRRKGRFSLKGESPNVRGNVQLVKGWFEDSLPTWKLQNREVIAFLHIDSDLYSSAMCILSQLNDQIVPGTVMVFDELFAFYETGPVRMVAEARALSDWMNQYDRSICVKSHSYRSGTVVVRR